ncbi:hypothetical protein JV202_03415 [Shewanella algae]|uniref:hypothetical protein n=1 Tax=Shewanella algae TaxID=38313 RepID=UPI001C053C82|nr:hypothetical protein [Shewanella algae]QWL06759.1 hypothetical protein JV202_03415 [Shewanella algae]
MSQFDKTLSVSLNPEDPASIALALQQYRQHLHDGSAFRLNGSLLFNIEFINQQQRPLNRDDAGANRPLLEHALDAARRDHRLSFYTEPVLFAAALNFPELLDELKTTAEAMVAFSRRRNDSSDLFIDDYNIFGVEALYMLARQYPELSHYLAAFLVPYWNLESFYQPVLLLGKLVEEFGWRRELIHAYLHCDGGQNRRCFFLTTEGDSVNLSLLEHFAGHPDDYPWFKAQLLKRLEQTPLLAYANEQPLEQTQLVLEFFYSLGDWPVEADIYNTELWRDRVKQQLILGLRVEDEALSLLAQLSEQSQPLVIVAEAWREDDRHSLWQTGEEQALAEDYDWDQYDNEPDSDYAELFYDLEESEDYLRIGELEELDAEVGEAMLCALAELPKSLGACAYAAYRLSRLNSPQSLSPDADKANEATALLRWLAQQLPLQFQHHIFYESGEYQKKRREHRLLKSWLTDIDTEGDVAKMAQIASEILYTSKDGKRIALLWSNGNKGFQNGLLALYFLLCAPEPAAPQWQALKTLAQRHWQLWLTLDPLQLIEKVYYCWADYAFYQAIDDEHIEAELRQNLLKLGVSEAQLDAHCLLTEQQVAAYRPADKRFWQSYITRLSRFAEAAPEDNSMIGRRLWQQQQQLLQALDSGRELPRLSFFGHLKANFPETPLPQAFFELFDLCLRQSFSKSFPEEQAQNLCRQLKAYLESGEGLEPLTPQTAAELQDWAPCRSDDPADAAELSDFVWLLPEAQGRGLALFLAGLGTQSLYWLHRPSVETAYVNHLIAEGGLSMAQRWEDQSIGHKRHSDYDTGLAFQSAKENWALGWLDSIGVAPQSTVYFAVSQGRAPAPFLKHLADEGRLPETSQLLTIDERVRLLKLLAQAGVDAELFSSFLQDESAAVRQLAKDLAQDS